MKTKRHAEIKPALSPAACPILRDISTDL